jgi:putative ABC transport system substrate-binding protein
MELLPGISRIAYIGGRNNVVTGYSIPDVHAVQRLLGFTLIEKFLTSPDAIEPMAASLVEERVQGVVVQWDNFTSLQMQRIVDALNNARLPAMYNPRDFVDAGGLISYGARISDNYVRAAFYVNRILRGQKPGELPIEQPRYYDLVLNQKTADKLGITVPFTIYIRAEEILD